MTMKLLKLVIPSDDSTLLSHAGISFALLRVYGIAQEYECGGKVRRRCGGR